MRSTRIAAPLWSPQEVQQPRHGDRGQARGSATVHPAGEGGAVGVGGVGGNGDSDDRNENNDDDDNGHFHPDRAGTGQATEAKVSSHKRKRNRLSLLID